MVRLQSFDLALEALIDSFSASVVSLPKSLHCSPSLNFRGPGPLFVVAFARVIFYRRLVFSPTRGPEKGDKSRVNKCPLLIDKY